MVDAAGSQASLDDAVDAGAPGRDDRGGRDLLGTGELRHRAARQGGPGGAVDDVRPRTTASASSSSRPRSSPISPSSPTCWSATGSGSTTRPRRSACRPTAPPARSRSSSSPDRPTTVDSAHAGRDGSARSRPASSRCSAKRSATRSTRSSPTASARRSTGSTTTPTCGSGCSPAPRRCSRRAAISRSSHGGSATTDRGGEYGVIRRDRAKPLIAAVEGPALGGGFEIVLACDLVVAARDASFGLPEVKRGLVPTCGGLFRTAARAAAQRRQGDAADRRPARSGARRTRSGLVNVRRRAGRGGRRPRWRWRSASARSGRSARAASLRALDATVAERDELGWAATTVAHRQRSAERRHPRRCGRVLREARAPMDGTVTVDG